VQAGDLVQRLASRRNSLELPSEGRGHRFESCRARQTATIEDETGRCIRGIDRVWTGGGWSKSTLPPSASLK